MIEFYFHYDRIRGQAELVIKGQHFWTDQIDCRVPTRTKRNNVFPHFVVEGYCRDMLEFKDKIILQ
jgi:hypothetical protein